MNTHGTIEYSSDFVLRLGLSAHNIKDSRNSSSPFFVSELHLFHNFVIFNDIGFKFSAVIDNIFTIDLQQ